MKDALGQELNVGDTVAISLCKSDTLYKATILELQDKYHVKVLRDGQSRSGWTYNTRVVKVILTEVTL